ncbi:protein containing Pyruvate kinase, barrel domain protein [gut metagenome]|uniref:Protein containing Pyruvate kinase, barrel domain protein n=1 Tax=gut metagenome TaxID=749906 RepID=J9FR25_9ZZZZ
MAIESDLDFIAHSFVRSPEDVLNIQNILDSYHSHIQNHIEDRKPAGNRQSR